MSDGLDTPLDQLAEARTPADLIRAHRGVSRAISARRAKAARTQGPLAQTYVAVMEQWDREKVEGMSREDRLQHLEVVLRAAWPQGREWKFNCTRCHDTGWSDSVCRAGQRCAGVSTRTDHPSQRPGKFKALCAMHAGSAYEHDYVTPCFCAKGEGFRRALEPKAARGDDFTTAGRSKSMTRAGR